MSQVTQTAAACAAAVTRCGYYPLLSAVTSTRDERSAAEMLLADGCLASADAGS